MIKKRFSNDEIQKWYERLLKARVKSDESYLGLTLEEADEKYHRENGSKIGVKKPHFLNIDEDKTENKSYTQEDCIRDTKEHIEQVRRLMTKFIEGLVDRAVHHDKSKLKSPELELFTEYTPKLKQTTYGSDEYKEYLKGLKVALDHHYANNSHHPEFYSNGIRGMNLLDIVEMFCDWKAATMRHDDGDINKSIEINKERFNISDDLVEIFKNSVDLFE